MLEKGDVLLMGVFALYLFIATATPLFLWTEHRKLVYMQLPFLIALWSTVVLYFVFPESTLLVVILSALFVGNILFSHYAAFMIYVYPAFLKERNKRKLGSA